MKRKLPAILILVATVVTVFSLSCSAYWVSVGTRQEGFAPVPTTYMTRADGIWTTFSNYPYRSANTQVNDIFINGQNFDYSSALSSPTVATSNLYLQDDNADRLRFLYPTLRLSENDNPYLDDAYAYAYMFNGDTPAESRMVTYEINYTVRWLSLDTRYYISDDDSTLKPTDADHVTAQLTQHTHTSTYTNRTTLRFHQQDGRFLTFRDNGTYTSLYFSLPDVNTLKQVDSELRELLSEDKPIGSQVDVEYGITCIPSGGGIFQLGDIIEAHVDPSTQQYTFDLSQYDASASSLASNFSFYLTNPANLFNFITASFNSVMGIEIAGITLGDILGIGVAISVLIIVLKIFAGG